MIALEFYAKVIDKMCFICHSQEHVTQLNLLLPAINKAYPELSISIYGPSETPDKSQFAFVKEFYANTPIMEFFKDSILNHV